MARTVGIIQARMGSIRLPSKVMLDIAGHPMLWHVVNRVSRAKRLDHVLVATRDHLEDGELWAYCNSQRWDYYAGARDDVLARFVGAASYSGADTIVRICGDSPLIDPGEIDRVVSVFHDDHLDYVTNAEPPETLPDGLDCQAFSRDVLARAHASATLASDREHVCLWMRRNCEKLGFVRCEDGDFGHLRFCVDEQRDLDFVRAVYAEIGCDRHDWRQVLNLLKRKPELAQINAGIERNAGYAKSLREDKRE